MQVPAFTFASCSAKVRSAQEVCVGQRLCVSFEISCRLSFTSDLIRGLSHASVFIILKVRRNLRTGKVAKQYNEHVSICQTCTQPITRLASLLSYSYCGLPHIKSKAHKHMPGLVKLSEGVVN